MRLTLPTHGESCSDSQRSSAPERCLYPHLEKNVPPSQYKFLCAAPIRGIDLKMWGNGTVVFTLTAVVGRLDTKLRRRVSGAELGSRWEQLSRSKVALVDSL